MKVDFSKVKVGDVFSETQYYKVQKIAGDKIQFEVDGDVDPVVLDKGYVENLLDAASQYTSEVKVSRTEIIQKFMSHPYTAMELSFNKKVDSKDVVAEIKTTYLNTAPKDLDKALDKAVKRGLEGEERIITGRHHGSVDEYGRVHFLDMKIDKDRSATYDKRQRVVDPRTINYLVVKNVKYIAK